MLKLIATNAEFISAKSNSNFLLISQRHEIENQINQNYLIFSQEENDLPVVQTPSNFPDIEGTDITMS